MFSFLGFFLNVDENSDKGNFFEKVEIMFVQKIIQPQHSIVIDSKPNRNRNKIRKSIKRKLICICCVFSFVLSHQIIFQLFVRRSYKNREFGNLKNHFYPPLRIFDQIMQLFRCSFLENRKCLLKEHNNHQLYNDVFEYISNLAMPIIHQVSYPLALRIFHESVFLSQRNCIIFPRLVNWCFYVRGLANCPNESIFQGRSYFNVFVKVSNCFFIRTSLFTGNGGVIYINGGNFCLDLSYSMFHLCSCSNEGGAIFFVSTNSSLRKVCSSRCSGSYYNFARIQSSEENLVDYLSVTLCHYIQSGYVVFRLYSGYQIYDHSNSSLNKVYRVSGIGIGFSLSFIGSFCTFSNNNSSDWACFYSKNCKGTLTFTNIVHNNSPTGYGIVHINENHFKMNYCLFSGNTNALFCVELGSLELSHTLISHSGVYSIMTPFVLENNNSISPVTYRQSYNLEFFQSHYCNADNRINGISFTFFLNPIKSNILLVHFGIVMSCGNN